MIKRIIFMLIASTVLFACIKTEERNPYIDGAGFFAAKSEFGAYNKSGDIIVFNEEDQQIAVSQDDFSFRIQSDDQSSYLSVQCATNPSLLKVGNEIQVSIVAKGISGISTSEQTMTIVKMENGVYWIMNAAADTGIVFTLEQ